MRISCVMVPPGGNADPEGDSICSEKLRGTAAWNENKTKMMLNIQICKQKLFGDAGRISPFLLKKWITTNAVFQNPHPAVRFELKIFQNIQKKMIKKAENC